MSDLYKWGVVAVCCLVTMGIRSLPFVIFSRREIPAPIKYIGKVLPYAVLISLIVFCVRNTSVTVQPYGIPEAICVILCAILQYKLKNAIPSIAISTVAYIVLTRLVF